MKCFNHANFAHQQPLPAIMKKIITILFIFFLGGHLYGQSKDNRLYLGNVVSDTTGIRKNFIEKPIPLQSIMKSKNDIEIRFIKTLSGDLLSFTVLTFDKTWKIKYYYYKNRNDTIFSKNASTAINLDTVFSKLVLNNIFSLRFDSTITYGDFYLDTKKHIIICTGGATEWPYYYFIEFKVCDYYRRYGVCDPEHDSEIYPRVIELKCLMNIINIFDELTKE